MPKKKVIKEPTEPVKLGRPSDFTQDLADEICEQLSEGISLRTVCIPNTMPAARTVFRWLRTNEEFCQQYARAKQESADAMGEEILDLSDGAIGVIKSGAEKKSGALAQAVRLQVDTRKWLMSKHKPKKYGDKLDLTTDGEALPAPIFDIKNVILPNDSHAEDSEIIEED